MLPLQEGGFRAELELALHQSLTNLRLWGEWFLLTNDDVLRLMTLLKHDLLSMQSSENNPQLPNQYLDTARLARDVT